MFTGPECFTTSPSTDGENCPLLWKYSQETRVSPKKQPFTTEHLYFSQNKLMIMFQCLWLETSLQEHRRGSLEHSDQLLWWWMSYNGTSMAGRLALQFILELLDENVWSTIIVNLLEHHQQFCLFPLCNVVKQFQPNRWRQALTMLCSIV